MNSIIKPVGMLAILLVLAGCSGDEGDDLDQFMAEAPKSMSANVDPLPQVQPYVPLQFNVDGSISDPFKPRKAISKGSFQPNLSRPKQPLESYPLENLNYVGLLSKAKSKFALIKTPDNTVHQVEVGNYLGTNFGMVTAITDTEVSLKEIIQDDLSGDWVERISSLSLQE
jgi:type IV pilus assembly protein PilP